MTIFVTGAAGFIGMHVCRQLADQGHDVVGIDNLNTYYMPALKQGRLAQLSELPGFTFLELDIADGQALDKSFAQYKPTHVIHLAAQAGVRYSIENPAAYTHSNLVGFANMLESCRQHEIEHLVYASSSSVYGDADSVPFNVEQRTDSPVSFYAATKKANEVMAHSYSHLYGLPTTGVRFFTVYGSWGRPDMAPWLFTDAILGGRPIKVFNEGRCSRDFTHISDIASGTVKLLTAPFLDPKVPCEVHNIGNQTPVELEAFIREIETVLGRRAEKIYLPAQPGDVERTFADTSKLTQRTGYQATMPFADGIREWADWFRNHPEYHSE